jgi:Ca2+-transporting ATPase
MVTGDNINTAKAIARECGILTEDGIAIEGAEFREKNPKELLELIPKMQVCHISSNLSLACKFLSIYRKFSCASLPVC